MKKTIFVMLCLAAFVVLLTYCNRVISPISESPIAVIGHGSILDKEGNQVKLTETLIRQIQDLYIRKLSDPQLAADSSGEFNADNIKATKTLISKAVSDNVLANALILDWLIKERKPKEEGQFSMVNNALRWYYVLKIQKNPILPDNNKRWSKGIPDKEAKKLEDGGIVVYSITNSSMREYCQECLDAGVPVPNNMFGPEWKPLGSFDNEFISTPEQAELLIYVSESPKGFCLALPRYEVSGSSVGNEAVLFGVICLGTKTSKACFFDNPRGNLHVRDQVIDFRDNFVGGQDLVFNGQGICTDCHAGENPYIVHPEKTPFANITDHVPSTMAANWYDPIVVASWPQNPGPTYILDAVSSTSRCTSCHQQGGAGRFPDIPALFNNVFGTNEYCSAVLNQALRSPGSGGTMPPSGFTQSQFQAHINTLRSLCDDVRYPGEVTTVSETPNNSFISSPIVIDPLYACVTNVAVKGVVLDAKATLFVNGAVVATINPARNPAQLDFNGIPQLNPGDSVWAQQEIGGAVSAPSAIVVVRKYQEDYPAGLPKPTIDPTTIYSCAELIAVRHMQGARLIVYTNGANPRSRGTSTEWSAIGPSGAPFNVNDVFTAQITLCGDSSPISDPVSAQSAPSALSIPSFYEPPTIYSGQELLNINNIEYGAKVRLHETVSNWNGSFSTPITWHHNYDIKTAMGRPIQSGDNIQLSQKLCANVSDLSPTFTPINCQRMPAPMIETPIAGNNFVIVTVSIPGARIMIYDSSNNEIGDGSGTVIVLSRAIVSGETLTVVQQLGECRGQFGYVVRATSGKQKS